MEEMNLETNNALDVVDCGEVIENSGKKSGGKKAVFVLGIIGACVAFKTLVSKKHQKNKDKHDKRQAEKLRKKGWTVLPPDEELFGNEMTSEESK